MKRILAALALSVLSCSAFAEDAAPSAPAQGEQVIPHFENGKPAGYTKVPARTGGEKFEMGGMKKGAVIRQKKAKKTKTPTAQE